MQISYFFKKLCSKKSFGGSARPPPPPLRSGRVKHQQKRLDELTSLLLNRGITLHQSTTALPVQLLTSSGEINFSVKSDLMHFLYKTYPDAFLTEPRLFKVSNSFSHISCIIIDGMFKFRHIQAKGTITLEEMCKS